MQRSALYRARRELSNAYLLAKFRLDTAENEPCKVCTAPALQVAAPVRPLPGNAGTTASFSSPSGPRSPRARAASELVADRSSGGEFSANWKRPPQNAAKEEEASHLHDMMCSVSFFKAPRFHKMQKKMMISIPSPQDQRKKKQEKNKNILCARRGSYEGECSI